MQLAADAPARRAHRRREIEVRVDPTQLHQVVWNLCDNAMRHARQGQRELPTSRSAAAG